MVFEEVFGFDAAHGSLPWPWIAFGAGSSDFAYLDTLRSVQVGRVAAGAVSVGSRFTIPQDLATPGSFSTDRGGARVAIVANTAVEQVVAVLGAAGELRRTPVALLAGTNHEARALVFDRTGARLWVSLESATETVVALVDAESLEPIAILRSAALPRPSLHELHLHHLDDAVLLVAACGDEGTFARVVGFSGATVSAIPTALDAGGISAGFVGFSADGKRVHLVEADELRTHAWPSLQELSSVPLAGDFVSSFAGAVLGHYVLVDGEDSESGEDLVMMFDRSAIRGALVVGRVATGMWAGAIGDEWVVTVEANGDPARGRVWRVSPPTSVFSN